MKILRINVFQWQNTIFTNVIKAIEDFSWLIDMIKKASLDKGFRCTPIHKSGY